MARGQPSDEALLAATAGGDRQALAMFYERHRAGVLGYFMHRVGDPELAFDLTAETFAAAISAAPRFRPGGPPASAWLFGIAANKLRESARKGRVEDEARRRLQMEPVVLEDSDLEEIVAIAAGQPVLPLLDGLPPDQRQAVHARVVDERSYSEIAVDLQCSEAVVRQRVHRGLDRMRRELEGRG